MQLTIQFLSAKNVNLVEIQRQIVHVYEEGAVNEGNVRKCVSCSKKAGQMCMMRKKVDAETVQVGNFQACSIQSQPCTE